MPILLEVNTLFNPHIYIYIYISADPTRRIGFVANFNLGEAYYYSICADVYRSVGKTKRTGYTIESTSMDRPQSKVCSSY